MSTVNYAVIFDETCIEHFDTEEEAVAEARAFIDGGEGDAVIWTSKDNELLDIVFSEGGFDA